VLGVVVFIGREVPEARSIWGYSGDAPGGKIELYRDSLVHQDADVFFG